MPADPGDVLRAGRRSPAIAHKLAWIDAELFGDEPDHLNQVRPGDGNGALRLGQGWREPTSYLPPKAGWSEEYVSEPMGQTTKHPAGLSRTRIRLNPRPRATAGKTARLNTYVTLIVAVWKSAVYSPGDHEPFVTSLKGDVGRWCRLPG